MSYIKNIKSLKIRDDYMSNSFRPIYSKEIYRRKTGDSSINLRKVINSQFELYAEIGHTKRSKAVRLTEKLLIEIRETLPSSFIFPKIIVINFDYFEIDAIGGYNRRLDTIFINEKYNTREKISSYITYREGYYANTTVYAPLRHELGHKYYYDLIEKYAKRKCISYNEAEQRVNDQISNYVHKYNDDGYFLEKQLSIYAQEGYSQGKYGEIVAESFSLIDTNTIAQEIIALLEGLNI